MIEHRYLSTGGRTDTVSATATHLLDQSLAGTAKHSAALESTTPAPPEGTVGALTLLTSVEATLTYWATYGHLRFVKALDVDLRPVCQYMQTVQDAYFDFRESLLRRCSFAGVELIKPLFGNAILDQIDFSDTSLHSPMFVFADLRRCTFVRAQLHTASVQHCTVVGSDFSDATLEWGRWSWSQLAHDAFAAADLRRVTVDHCTLDQVRFPNITGHLSMDHCVVQRSAFTDAQAVLALGQHMTWESVDFAGARLPASHHGLLSYLLREGAITVEQAMWAGVAPQQLPWCWPRWAVTLKRRGNERIMEWIVRTLAPWAAFRAPVNAMLLVYWPDLVQRGVWCGPLTASAHRSAQWISGEYTADPNDNELEMLGYDPTDDEDEDEDEDDGAEEND